MKPSPSRSKLTLRSRRRRATLWKSGVSLTASVLTALACTCGARHASAQAAGGTIYYWDGNGASPGAGTNAQVTNFWEFDQNNFSDTLWSTSATGTNPEASNLPTANDLVVFNASDGVAADNPNGGYTVTLTSPEDVYGIVIGPTTYSNTNNSANTIGGVLTLAGSGSPGLTIGAGGVTLNGSSQDATFAASIGTVTLDADQTWTINNTHVIAVNSAVAGDAAAGATRTWTLGNVGAYTPNVSGVVSDGTNGGNLGITLNNTSSTTTTPSNNGGFGGGTWIISNTANTFTGATNIARGNLQIASLANLGTPSSLGAPTTVANGTISIGSGTYAGSLTYNGGAASTTNRAINLAGTTGGATIYNNSGSAANTLTFTGGFTNTGAGAKTFILRGTNTGNNAFGGALVDSTGGALSVAKYDAGQWTLSSGGSSFTGGLTVGAGTLNLTGASTFSGGITLTGGTLAVGAAGNLGSNVAANSISIKGGNLLLAANGNVGSNQAVNITSVGGGIGVSATPGTAFPAVTAAAGAPIVFGLNYTGTGGIGMTGGANGTTDVPGVDALFTSSSATFLGAFAAGTGSGTYTGTTLPVGANNTYRVGGGGGTIQFQNSVFTGANNLLAGTTGGGTVILPNANTYTGTTTIQNGTLTATSLNRVSGGTASSSLGAPTTVANGTITIGSGNNTAIFNYAGVGETTDRVLNIAGSGGTSALTNNGTGAVNFSSTPTFSQTGAQTLQLGAATDSIGGSIGAVADASSTATTSLSKQGLTNSTWTIGTSTYTGNTTINGGVLSSPTVLANSGLVTLAGSNTTNLAVLQTNGTFARNIGTTTGLNWQTNGGFAALGGKLTVTLNGNAQVSYGTTGFFPNNGTMSFGSTTANNQVELTNPINLATNDNFARTIYVEKGAGGDSALLSGVLSQPSNTGSNPGITKQGAGTLILSGANTFSGPVTVSAGALVAGTNSTGTTSGAFGTGTGPTANPTSPSTITLGDGNTGAGTNPSVLIGGAFTVGRPLAISDNGTNNTYSVGGTTDANSTFSGLISVNTGAAAANNNTFTVTQVATTGTNALNITGGMAVNRAVTFNNVGTVNVATGAITGGGTLTKTNTGLLTLAAANTYTGATTVSGGTLLVNGSTVAASAFTVGGGTLGGAGTVNGAVTLNTGGQITGGGLGAVGTLSLGGTVTLNSGSVFQVDLGSGGASDRLAITGALLSNGATINVNSGALNGTSTYIIATYASDTGSTFVLSNAPNYQTVDTGTMLELVPSTPVPEPSVWAAVLTFVGLGGFFARRRSQPSR